MKHAGAEALARLASLLAQVRLTAGGALVERKPGTFYRRGEAFLHFHEDPAGLFADLKIDGGWQRTNVSGAAGCASLIAPVKAQLG